MIDIDDGEGGDAGWSPGAALYTIQVRPSRSFQCDLDLALYFVISRHNNIHMWLKDTWTYLILFFGVAQSIGQVGQFTSISTHAVSSNLQTFGKQTWPAVTRTTPGVCFTEAFTCCVACGVTGSVCHACTASAQPAHSLCVCEPHCRRSC